MLSASVEADTIPEAARTAKVIARVNLGVDGVEPAIAEITVTITPRTVSPEVAPMPRLAGAA